MFCVHFWILFPRLHPLMMRPLQKGSGLFPCPSPTSASIQIGFFLLLFPTTHGFLSKVSPTLLSGGKKGKDGWLESQSILAELTPSAFDGFQGAVLAGQAFSGLLLYP